MQHKALTDHQYALVMKLAQTTADRERWFIVKELVPDSTDSDCWIDSYDADIRMIWAELNGVEL
jgi:hypothetical protein